MAPQLSLQAQIGHVRRQAAQPSESAVTPSTPTEGTAPAPTGVASNLECGIACIRLGDISDCAADQTQSCLCNSAKYIASVDTCLSSRCTPSDAKAGSEYSYGACLFLGVNVSTIAIPSATSGIDLNSPPVVNYQTFVNVQAIMSSICSALLALALILGFFACRARARVETQTQQGSWANMGTTQHTRSQAANGGKSFGGVSRGFDPTATFASASYPAPARAGGGMGMERSRGFTNRLTLDEEEWEMGATESRDLRSVGRGMGRGDAIGEERGGSGPGSASSFVSSAGKEEMDLKAKDGELSPATFTTNGRSRAGSEVELEGSTIHLATLTRGTGAYGRAI